MYQQHLWLKPAMALPFYAKCLLLCILSFLFTNTSDAQLNPGCTNDILAPVITPVSSNIRIALDATGNRSISLTDIATVTDNCNPAPAYTLSAAGFNCSNVGQQMITVTATDGSFGTTASEPAVSFSDIYGVAIDATGNIYLADFQNQAIRKISTTGMVTTLAGSGIKSFANGIGTAASFNDPVAVAVDGSGNVFVADQGNNKIRKITPSGVVTTFAGSGTAGSADGTGTGASFNHPYGIATDATGNVYVSDTYNHRIRKISPGGVVTTVGGSTLGYADGGSTIAQFDRPMGLAVDASGNIYVADFGNILIRKISASGLVSTLAGNGQEGFADGVGIAASFRTPWHITINPSGDLFITDSYNYAVRKITSAGVVSTIAGNGSEGSLDGDGSIAQFSNPHGIASDPSGNLFISDVFNYKIRKISTSYVVSTFAGGMYGAENGNIGGFASGNQSILQIAVTVEQSPPVFTSAPQPEITITIGANCTAPIPDFKSSATATSGCGPVTLTQSPTQGVPAPLGRRPVTIIATDIHGMQSYQTSYIDIVDGTAPVITPVSNNIILPLNSNGTRTITLADIATIQDNCNANPVYEISPSTFNCSSTGQQTVTVTATDGTFGGTNPSAVSFSQVYGVAIDVTGNIYLADLPNHAIRKISATGIVTTLAGTGSSGFANGVGASASFHNPVAVAVDGSGNVYVADQINNRIRKITAAGVVTTFAGSGAPGSADGIGIAASFNNPYGIAIDAAGNLYVGDTENSRIRKISPAGVVTTIAGSSPGNVNGIGTASKFDRPMGLTVDAAGNIYVVDNSNQLIRKISSSGVVSTLAGSGIMGFTDGTGSGASFRSPWHITIDPDGNLYVTDINNHAIRKITQAGVVSTIAGNGTNGSAEGPGVTARFFYPFGIASDNIGNLFIGDGLNYKIRKITPNYVVSTLAGSGVSGFQNGNIGTAATGNQSTLQIPVTIIGQSTPVFTTTQANVSVTGTGNGCSSILENYISSASATSSCGGGGISITQSPLAGTVLPLGVNMVTLTATDASGNSATQTFTVVVLKITPPGITPLSNNVIISLGADGIRVINPSDVATVSDCGHSPLAMVSPSTFSCADIGIKTVTVTATDGTFGTSNPGAVQFNHPVATAVDPAGNIFVADRGNFKIRKISPAGVVSTFADGNSTAQGQDGRFSVLADMACDNNGNIYLADAVGNRVRKITPAGAVSVLAGNGSSGMIDGTGTAASFVALNAITVSSQGIIYVADNNVIRKITASGVVSTLAGNTTGFADGNGTAAKFWGISGLATDTDGNIYVADGANYRVRKVTPAGLVTTIAGGVNGFADGPVSSAKFGFLHAVVVDSDNNIYVTDSDNGRIRKISSAGIVSTFSGGGPLAGADGNATSASFDLMPGMAMDVNRTMYIPEINTHRIRKVDINGNVTTIAGNGVAGYQEGSIITGGTGNQTSLQIQVTIKDATAPIITPVSNNIQVNLNENGTATISLADIATVNDNCNNLVSVRITPATFDCTTIGNQTITIEATDGTFGSSTPAAVSFSNPISIASDHAGNFYIADRGSESIRKISSTGTVTLFAGGGTEGYADGQGANARFRTISDIASDASGNIFVADAGNRRIRKITAGGFVSTIAGNGSISSSDGTGTSASFESPNAIAVDPAGIIYVADFSRIRKITTDGEVTTIAGSTAGFADGNGLAAKFWGPGGLVTDASGNLFIADGANNKVRKMTSSGAVTTIAGNGDQGYTDGAALSARFQFLHAITLDALGNIYVCDNDNSRIRKISTEGIVTSIAGNGTQGATDGTGSAASFSGLYGMTLFGSDIYVSEFNNHKIRKITNSGIVTTFAGSGIQGSANGDLNSPGTGNQSSLQIQVQVIDIIRPVITCPSNITVPTTSIHPNQTGWATATDNCPAGLVISYTDNTAQGCNMLRTWKATDASGNFSTCTQSIAVPQMTVSLGPDMYILYGALGYTGCRTITPLIAGGAGPYTYIWSSTHAAVNNATSATITACNTMETTHTYTVTVTSANGCTATATIHLTFINISCSNNANNEKVTVCLRPQGNPTNCNTVCVAPSAAQILINNGSYYGKCLPGCEIPVQSITGNTGTNDQQQKAIEDDAENEAGRSFEVKVRNNPTQTFFSLTITSSTKENISLQVSDVLGRTIEIKRNVSSGELLTIGSKYGKGVFFAEIIQGGNRKTVKLVKQ